MKNFNGQPVFLDIWAIWCKPCIGQFKYKKRLDSFLQQHNIALVYISIDTDEFDDKWISAVAKYDLAGFHIRTNQQLRLGIFKEFGQNRSINIPQYGLLGPDGNILIRHAYRPGDKQKLFTDITCAEKVLIQYIVNNIRSGFLSG